MAHRELVFGHRELLADGMPEHVRDQAGQGLAGRRVAVGEVLQRWHVVQAGKQLADAFLAVATGASDLLRVRLEALWQVVVVDVADVRLVDPHPERDRRDHDRVLRARPPFLHRDPLLRVQAGVVRPGREARPRQQIGHAERCPLECHVHDRRPRRTLAQPLDQLPVSLGRGDRCREEREIRPVEAGDDGVCLFDPEARPDVRDDCRRRRRGERQHAFGGQLARPLGKLQIVGPKVVPPLGDAVRLVHGEQRDSRPRKLREEALVVEALRRYVQKLQRTGAEALEDLALLGRTQA